VTVAFGSTTNNGGGSATCNVPSGVTNGDLLILHVEEFVSTGTAACAGWTQCAGSPVTSSGSVRLAWFYRVAASEPASYTVTGITPGSSVVSITRFTGQDTTTPINASNGQINTSSTNSATPTITPSVANCLLFGLWNADANALTKPGSMTQANNADGGDFMDAYELLVGGSGSGVSRTATISGAAPSAAALIAIAPVGGGGGGGGLPFFLQPADQLAGNFT
jgi:hypothetical protein